MGSIVIISESMSTEVNLTEDRSIWFREESQRSEKHIQDSGCFSPENKSHYNQKINTKADLKC